ncbi:MAG: hypothetical protein Kow0031_13800 [Anaerolineae bacterium]
MRHGENPANITKEFSCRHVDYWLTDKGELQAQQTAEYLADKEIDEIYASPLKRAAETAQIIGDWLGLPVVVMDDFREVDVGELELHPTLENWTRHNQVLLGWLNGQPEVKFPGGDNYFSLWERMQRGLAKISKGKSDKNIVVVAHGGIFTLSMRDLCPTVDITQLLGGTMKNCSISEILVRLEQDRPVGELVTWAYHEHLHGEAAEFVNPLPEGT